MNEYDKLCEAWIRPACKHWFHAQCRNQYQRFYLYFKPSNGAIVGEFSIEPEALNDSWELASPEPISIAMSERQVFAHCKEIGRKLPVMATA